MKTVNHGEDGRSGVAGEVPRTNRPVTRLGLVGRTLLTTCAGAMVLGGAVMQIFFPERLGKGVDDFALSILIPIWVTGIAGLLLLLIDWLREPQRDYVLDTNRGLNPHALSPFTRGLGCFTLALVWLSMLLLAADETAASWVVRASTLYITTCLVWFLIYLAFIYAPLRHRATTTYLNHFSFAAILLIPLTWPVLIFAFKPAEDSERM